MRFKTPLGMSTYLIASTRRTRPIDLWTVCGVTDSLQNGSLPRVCSSNDEHSELDIWDTAHTGGLGAGAGAGFSGRVLWFAPMERKCCGKKDWATC